MSEGHISPGLARIVAHICADGYIGISKQRRSKNELLVHPRKNEFRKKFFFRYVNLDQVLVQEFIDDCMFELGRKVTVLRKHEYEVSAKWVYSLITKLGAGKSRDGYIAEEITTARPAVKIAWLRAFFDDEAHVSMKPRRIRLNIVNLNGLEQIKRLLEDLGISCVVLGPYRYRQYYSYHLDIKKKDVSRYAEVIGFHHPNKLRHLTEIVQENMMGMPRFERGLTGSTCGSSSPCGSALQQLEPIVLARLHHIPGAAREPDAGL
jgi:hypothetical protein